MSEVVITAPTTNVHKSRWGYHSCSFVEFLKLKKAHSLLRQAYCDVKRYIRWSRKLEENRVGPEPRHPSEFYEYGYHQTDKRKWYGDGFLTYKDARRNIHTNLYLYVLQQYRQARKPVATEAEVIPLRLPSNLSQLIEKLEKFYSQNESSDANIQ